METLLNFPHTPALDWPTFDLKGVGNPQQSGQLRVTDVDFPRVHEGDQCLQLPEVEVLEHDDRVSADRGGQQVVEVW